MHEHAPHVLHPRVVVFDVNETLSDLAPLAQRFASLGLPASLAPTWFAQVLRDGFALAAAGGSATFSTIAEAVLLDLFARQAPNRDVGASVQHVLGGFASLKVHPDVPGGVMALSAAGLRLVTLTNGATSVADGLLARAGVRDRFERLLSVEDAGAWKPDPQAYAHVVRQCDVSPEQMLLVAVHPWDIHGAAAAGLRTAWVDRRRTTPYPSYFTAPDLTVAGLDELAEHLAVPPSGR